jgi:uncharacterized membrane protein YjfL (UPF0719 family)
MKKYLYQIQRIAGLLSLWVFVYYTYPILRSIEEFSNLAVGETYVASIFTAILVLDILCIPEFNTWQELKKGNIAVAIYIGAVSIAIALALMASR